MKTKLRLQPLAFSLRPFTFALLSALVLFLPTLPAHAQTGWGTALSFDGVDDWVQMADSDQLDLTVNYTLECWFKADSFGGLRGLISKYHYTAANGYVLRLTGTDLDFDQMTTSGLNLQPGVWYHVAAVSSNRIRHLYLNGQEKALNGTPITVVANTDPLRLASDWGDHGGRPFKGQMDDARIWNVARSQALIQADIVHPLTGTETGLVAYYPLDEGSGITAYDATLNAHTGHLLNGSTWANGPTWVSSTVPSTASLVLRQAIANAVPGATLTLTNTGTITLTSGELLINKDLNIVGPGVAALVLSGNNNSRVFNIGSGVTVNLSGLTIRDGRSADGGAGAAGQSGGGIYNAGRLTLSDCVVTNNRAGNGGTGGESATGGAGGDGGGVYSGSSGDLTLLRCTVNGNASGTGGTGGRGGNGSDNFGNGGNGGPGGNGGNAGMGGGICGAGTLFLDQCTLNGNTTGAGGTGGLAGDGGSSTTGTGGDGGGGGDGGSGGFGGAVYANGLVTLTNCTLSGNTNGTGGYRGDGNVGGWGSWASGSSGPAGNGGAGGGGGGVFNANHLTLLGCTIADNSTSAGGSGTQVGSVGHGGGFYNSGVLILSDCVVSNNTTGNGGIGDAGRLHPGVAGGNGGGIYNGSGGVLTLNRSSIRTNFTGNGGNGGYGHDGPTGENGDSGGNGGNGGDGGGIYNDGILALNGCLLSGNRTGSAGTGGNGGNAGVNVLFGQYGGNGGNGGRGGFGGAVCAFGLVTLTNCTLSGNTGGAGAAGGGYGTGTGGTVSSGHDGSAGTGGDGGSGGGIYTPDVLVLVSCTVAHNSTGLGGACVDPTTPWRNGAVGRAGGIFKQASAQSAQLVNTIVALNTTPTNNTPDDVVGAFASLGHNLIGDTNGSTGFGASGDLLNVDSLVWPLCYSGGPTLTCPLSPDSPAIDAGDDSMCETTDQRGVSRPQDGNRDGTAHCDIGAYEARIGWPAAVVLPGTDTVGRQGATLNGKIAPNGEPALAWFEWGTNLACMQATPFVPVGGSFGVVPVSGPMSGVIPGQPYYVRLVVSNQFGIFYTDYAVFESLMTDRANWMSNRLDILGTRALKTLTLPASHDAAMYMQNPDFLLISLSVQQGLLNPTFDNYSVVGIVEAVNSFFHFDLISENWFESEINGFAGPPALTQDISIGGQLTNGIRYFDLRPKVENDTWYLYHGQQGSPGHPLKSFGKTVTILGVDWGYEFALTGVSVTGPHLTDVLDDVKSYMESHRELVILKLSHYQHEISGQPNPAFSDDDYLELINFVTNSLSPWLYTNLPPGKRLADVTLGEYLADHGTVLVVCDGYYSTTNPTPGIWAYEDYDSSATSSKALRVYDKYSNTKSYEEMKTNQFAKFESFGTANGTDTCDLFLLSWTLTGDGSKSISELAALANPYLADEMAALAIPNNQGRIPNLLYTDFVENSRSTDVAVYLNTAPRSPVLSMRHLGSNLELSIESTPGLQIQIEQTTDLANPVWTPVQTVTITNVPQVLTLPLPAERTAFWRAVVR